jgi:hypothetical protein
MLFFREWKVSPAAGFLVLGGSLLLAAAIRSRAAVFGWLFCNAALLPISFVPARSDGYVLYAAYPGCAIYVASVFQFIAEHLSLFFAVRWRPQVSVASALLFALLVVHVQRLQAAGHLKRGFAPGGQSLVSDLASTACAPGAAGKRRVILVNDPFGDDKWQPMFILRLSRNDMNLDVLRTNSAQLITGAIPEVQPGDQVLIYSDHHYREASATELRSFATIESRII